ncbi:MAG TPA: DUF5712 family protein [Mucilaginibacter sp.]|jgi:hypothetical protein|nr:DUF5712 family protein [Mucilaginibacter sp.]
MYINVTDKEAGNNKGSSGELVHYLEKENRVTAKQQPEAAPERWFSIGRTDIQPFEVRLKIDGNVAKLSKDEAKFYLVNISPSQKEIRFLKEKYGEKGAEEKLKEYAAKVMDEYAMNFKRPGINNSNDLVWFGKLEHYRYYTHKDKEVQQGLKKRGERKEGEQMHLQIIVSRKDATNKIKLSPLNKSSGKNEEHSKKVGQFNRVAFKASGETVFDSYFGFDRGIEDSFRYANGMKNGTTKEKVKLENEKTTEKSHRKNTNIEERENVEMSLLPAAKGLLDALLMPVRNEAAGGLLGRKKRKRKGQSHDQDLSL